MAANKHERLSYITFMCKLKERNGTLLDLDAIQY